MTPGKARRSCPAFPARPLPRARHKPKTLLKAMSQIVRHLGPVAAAHRQDLGGRPVDLPAIAPRAVRRSSPSTSRSTTTCPPWKRKTLSTSPSERPKSLRRRPVLASWRPNQREKPKTALTAARGFCKLRKSWSKVVSAPKPNLEGDVLLLDPKTKFLSLSLGPENQIPIPSH